MVKLIVGSKGIGKTARLVEEINSTVDSNKNIACIQHGSRLAENINFKVRLIDITEYPVSTFPELIAFIAGMYAKDYDLSHVYIDSLNKIVGIEGTELHAVQSFFKDIEELSNLHHFDITITWSVHKEELPESIKSYAIG